MNTSDVCLGQAVYLTLLRYIVYLTSETVSTQIWKIQQYVLAGFQSVGPQIDVINTLYVYIDLQVGPYYPTDSFWNKNTMWSVNVQAQGHVTQTAKCQMA